VVFRRGRGRPSAKAKEGQRRDSGAASVAAATTWLTYADEKGAALIDAIDHGKRGDDLAAAIGITKRELATSRKALKREVKGLWPEVHDELGEE
jgi:hypothetical protein